MAAFSSAISAKKPSSAGEVMNRNPHLDRAGVVGPVHRPARHDRVRARAERERPVVDVQAQFPLQDAERLLVPLVRTFGGS
nr:hypothetical protein [Streptomyces lasalocidi]